MSKQSGTPGKRPLPHPWPDRKTLGPPLLRSSERAPRKTPDRCETCRILAEPGDGEGAHRRQTNRATVGVGAGEAGEQGGRARQPFGVDSPGQIRPIGTHGAAPSGASDLVRRAQPPQHGGVNRAVWSEVQEAPEAPRPGPRWCEASGCRRAAQQ